MSKDPQSVHEAKVKELRDEYRNNVNEYDEKAKNQLINEIYHHEKKVEEIKRLKARGEKYMKNV